MITINILQINPSTGLLNVSVETSIGNKISSVKLWNEDNFKDYTKAVSLNDRLLNISNLEVFSLSPSEVGLQSFSGIYFLEFTTTDTETTACSDCSGNMLLGVVAELSLYQECLLDNVLDIQYDTSDVINNNQLSDVFNIKMTLEAICTSIRFGYYQEAIDMMKILKKLCKNKEACNTCNHLSTPSFRNNLGFGILDNDLILSSGNENASRPPIEVPTNPCLPVLVKVNGIPGGSESPLDFFTETNIGLHYYFSSEDVAPYTTPVLYNTNTHTINSLDNTTDSGYDIINNNDGTFTLLISPGFIGTTSFNYEKCPIT